METTPVDKLHKISGIGKFFGELEVKADDTERAKQVKGDWNKFVGLFWAVFLLKFATMALANVEIEEFVIAVLLWSSQFLPVLFMVAVMGYYAYKISSKKSYILVGLLGFIWFAVISIFIGYFAVKRITKDELRKAVSGIANATESK